MDAQELGNANLTTLMLAQKALRENPILAKQIFGLEDDEQANFIESLTPSALQKLSTSNISLFNFRFKKESLQRLVDYINGDQLALAHAAICSSGASHGKN